MRQMPWLMGFSQIEDVGRWATTRCSVSVWFQHIPKHQNLSHFSFIGQSSLSLGTYFSAILDSREFLGLYLADHWTLDHRLNMN